MAEKRVIELEVNAKKAADDIQDLREQFFDLKKSVESVEDSAKKTADNTSKGFKNLQGTLNRVKQGFSGVAVALKSIPVRLAQEGFNVLKEVFFSNQTVADAYAIALQSVKNIFTTFVNFVLDNSDKVIGFFKGIFEDPIGAIKDFGNAVLENLTERFKSYLDTLGFVASAVKKVFSGDFAGALDDIKSAGKEAVDVLTGVDGTVDKVAETLPKVTKAVTGFVKGAIDGAEAQVKLANAAELAAANQERLRITNLKAAEEQRQIRDDISEDIDKRIEANTKLGEILEKGIEQEKVLAEVALAAADAALANDTKNIQLQAEQIRALAAVAEIEERLGGQRSEQLTNEIALQQEKLDLIVSENEQQSNLRQIELQGAIESEKSIFKRFELEKQLLDEQLALAELNLEKTAEIFDEETLQFKNALKARDEAKAQSEAAQTAITIAEEDARREIGLTTLAMISQAAGKQSVLGKAAAIAQTIINTKEAVTNALKGAPVPFNFALAAATAAFGAKQVADIISTKVPGETMGMSGSVGGAQGTVPETTPPDFNVVGASPINQLAQSLNNQEPQRAFVVSGDVTTAQELDRNIITESGI
jgi:hypothetical protein|tara:strand:+ start:1397 stop:3172 length:1776 start_codon:yes stop_codon:yes gene_type:complete